MFKIADINMNITVYSLVTSLIIHEYEFVKQYLYYIHYGKSYFHCGYHWKQTNYVVKQM